MTLSKSSHNKNKNIEIDKWEQKQAGKTFSKKVRQQEEDIAPSYDYDESFVDMWCYVCQLETAHKQEKDPKYGWWCVRHDNPLS